MHEIRKDIHQLLDEHGKQFISTVLPSDIKRGPMSKCFDTCLLIALAHPEYRYVEGLAWVVPAEEDGPRNQILHAWLTDAEGKNAYDPTWYSTDKYGKEIAGPIVYFGIIMDAKKVGKFVTKTEYCCVLENQWRDQDLANNAIAVDKQR